MKSDEFDYSKTMPFYCKECGQCKNYKQTNKNLKVKNVGYGCRNIGRWAGDHIYITNDKERALEFNELVVAFVER